RVCVAGYLANLACVRPEFSVDGPTEDWCRRGTEIVVRPFSLVELDLIDRPRTIVPPHTEDWIVDPLYRVGKGLLDDPERFDLLSDMLDPSVAAIFGAPVNDDNGRWVAFGSGQRSLGTIRPEAVVDVSYWPKESAERSDYRLAFIDANGDRYRLAVVDLAFRRYLDELRRQLPGEHRAASAAMLAALQSSHVFLRIGLARRWAKFPDRCYLQITGVHAFPDYLDGRCFADFAQPLPSDRPSPPKIRWR
ncbi:MAG TPA: hypothetical protein VFU81_05095, partial [Thermomicrobiales bacterium]|nr:hypothetical protein [Thermomicrobiales bacterium]